MQVKFSKILLFSDKKCRLRVTQAAFWRWGELNPRPKVEAKYIYMFSYAR